MGLRVIGNPHIVHNPLIGVCPGHHRLGFESFKMEVGGHFCCHYSFDVFLQSHGKQLGVLHIPKLDHRHIPGLPRHFDTIDKQQRYADQDHNRRRDQFQKCKPLPPAPPPHVSTTLTSHTYEQGWGGYALKKAKEKGRLPGLYVWRSSACLTLLFNPAGTGRRRVD